VIGRGLGASSGVALRAVNFPGEFHEFVQKFETIGGEYTCIGEISGPESGAAEDSGLLGQDPRVLS
jgi:hypothetical protein